MSTPEPPPLRPWSRVWRYLLAIGLGAAAWIGNAADRLVVPLTTAQEDVIGALLFLDALFGVLALALLPLRRRLPLAVAVVTTALSALSVSSLGAGGMAVTSMATRRRRSWMAVVGAVAFVSAAVFSSVRQATAPDGRLTWTVSVAGILLGMLPFAMAMVTGLYVATRRELVTSLEQRAMTAAEAARESERTRIAREMHDVLAHRISLVALHAGALTYRDDLSRAQTVETAEIIQANAELALVELRQVLGVLRGEAGRTPHGAGDARGSDGSDGPDGTVLEPPQPTLAELPALLADAREAGARIRCTAVDGLVSRMPDTLSRTGFRIVQEALTNARKHAPAEPVDLRLDGAPGGELTIEVSNAAPPVGRRGSPAGVGLLGLAERVHLAGGTLTSGPRSDGSFVVSARLPWHG